MISRRSFLEGLVAALVAPPIVRRTLDAIGWRTSYTGWIGVCDPHTDPSIVATLHRRMNDAYAEMARNISTNLYPQVGDREQTAGEIGELAGDYCGIGITNTEDRRYLTVRESLLERSEHHFQRAAYWRIQGKPDYAMGSLMKAAKAENRARSLPA